MKLTHETSRLEQMHNPTRHAHHSHARTDAGVVLRFSLGATFLYIVVAIVTGVRAHSLALLSEAGHNVSDFLALLLSLVAVYVANRPPSSRKSYGYHRAGVLAAFVNALTLVAVAGYIFFEAGQRLLRPVAVKPGWMMGVAALGVLMNGAIAAMLWNSSRDVNIRSALIHMLGDTLSTSGVIVGGFMIQSTGQLWIDPALSFGIGALILWSSFGIIRETLNILLEGTPRGMDTDAIVATMSSIKGVNYVHDLHVWSIGSNSHALSCHIGIADIPPSESEQILREVRTRLERGFNISHTTIQFENVVCDVAHGCVIPISERMAHREHQRPY